jgi:hypothetical protein
LSLDGLYKVGTRLSQVRGPDGNVLGWSLPVGRADGTVIGTGLGKVESHDTDLLLEDGLAPALERVSQEFGFGAAPKPRYKCILTVTVRPMIVNSGRAPVVRITGLEILGRVDLLQVARGRFDTAFRTVQVTPERSFVTYGDGSSWISRLGGETYVQTLRHRLRELERRRPRCSVSRRAVLNNQRVISPGSSRWPLPSTSNEVGGLADLIGRSILSGSARNR